MDNDLNFLYSCSCPEGWTGDRCDILINKCLSNPCRNGGTCTSLQLAGYNCQCPYPWSGTICETNIDVCYFNPCLAFGTCFQSNLSPSGYQCICAPGFIGRSLLCFTLLILLLFFKIFCNVPGLADNNWLVDKFSENTWKDSRILWDSAFQRVRVCWT